MTTTSNVGILSEELSQATASEARVNPRELKFRLINDFVAITLSLLLGAFVSSPLCVSIAAPGGMFHAGADSDAPVTVASPRTLPGAVDLSFRPGFPGPRNVFDILVQDDGKVVAVSLLSGRAEMQEYRVERLTTDGSLDPSFDPAVFTGGAVVGFHIALGPDGRIYAAGDFMNVNQISRPRIARLNTDGTLDPTFDPGTGPNEFVSALIIDPQGKILIGGSFSQVNGISRSRLARLLADGSVDPEFLPKAGPHAGLPNSPFTILSVTGGSLLLDGHSFILNGSPHQIGRYNANGEFTDWHESLAGGSFSPPTHRIRVRTRDTFRIQADGKTLVASHFVSAAGAVRTGIFRLNTDGTFDSSFDAGLDQGTVMAMDLSSDATVILAGTFSQVHGVSRPGFARLLGDGQLDPTFDPGTGANGFIRNIINLPNGKILIAGNFTAVDGVTRYGVARLFGKAQPGTLHLLRKSQTELQLFIWTAPGNVYSLEATDSLTQPNWKRLAEFSGDGALKGLTESLAPVGQRFYRLQERESN